MNNDIKNLKSLYLESLADQWKGLGGKSDDYYFDKTISIVDIIPKVKVSSPNSTEFSEKDIQNAEDWCSKNSVEYVDEMPMNFEDFYNTYFSRLKGYDKLLNKGEFPPRDPVFEHYASTDIYKKVERQVVEYCVSKKLRYPQLVKGLSSLEVWDNSLRVNDLGYDVLTTNCYYIFSSSMSENDSARPKFLNAVTQLAVAVDYVGLSHKNNHDTDPKSAYDSLLKFAKE